MDGARFRDAERRLWESVGVQPVEHRVALRRVGTSVRVLEVGDGPALLFVHGATNGGSSWATLAAALPDHRCLLLDRPGCGLSDPLPGRLADLEALAGFGQRLVPDVLDALGVASAPVIGTSYGGYFAIQAAAAAPTRVERLVLFGWSVGASAPPPSVRVASQWPFGRLMAAAPVNERTVRSLLGRIGLRSALESGRFSPAMLDWYVALLRDTDTLRNELGSGPPFPVLRMDDRLLLPAPALGRVEAPVAMFWGEDDPFGGADVARRFAGLVPGATLELRPGVGHAPWIDEPERAAAFTRDARDVR